MKSARAASVAIAFIALIAGAAAAQGPEPSLAERAAAVSRRMAEYLELLDSPDQTIRSAAFHMALADDSPAIRGLALINELRRFKQLLPEIIVAPGGRIGVGDVPSVELHDLAWSEDGRSFQGWSAQQCSNAPVSGMIAGERLALRYEGICIASLLLAKPGQAGTAKGDAAHLPCEAMLILNKEHNALEGPLRCAGMPITLPVRLPFG